MPCQLSRGRHMSHSHANFRFHWSNGLVLQYEAWQLRAEDVEELSRYKRRSKGVGQECRFVCEAASCRNWPACTAGKNLPHEEKKGCVRFPSTNAFGCTVS